MEKLDISKLIEKAEELVYNGKLNGAAKAKVPVQSIKIGGFNNYDISLLAERDSHYEERLEDVIDIPLENTPFNLFLWAGDWTQDGIAPNQIVCSGYIESEDLNYLLYCAKDSLNNFINDKKKKFAKGYGYNYWGEIMRQQDKNTLFDMMNTFVKKLLV